MERRSRTTRISREKDEPTTRQQRRPGLLPSALIQRIGQDPVFQVATSDAGHWIHPYTGEAVAVIETVRKTAERSLSVDGTWRDGEPYSLGELEILRWKHELVEAIPREERLRLFAKDDRGWLNPYSGEFHAEVRRHEGWVTQRTVKAMAQALATCPFARHGGLLDRAELARRIRGVETPARERVASGPLEYRDSGRAPSSAEIAYRQQDLEKARDVQTNMFSRLPTIPGYEFGVHYSAQQQVSGDFYDVITLDDERCLMVVGDVTGHGMQAALVATSALKALRIMVKQGLGHDLRKLLGELNENVKTDLLPGQFITLFAAVFDHQSDSGTAVLAGHHPAIIARGGDEPSLRSIGAKGAAIGILPSATLMRVLSPVEFELASDEVLVQFTDGVVEAPGKGGEEFGMHRLVAEVFRHINEEMRVMADGIAAASVAHEGGSTADDVTVFALRRR